MSKLTAEAVDNIFKDCLFKNEEIVNGKPIVEPKVAEGIVSIFGFHPTRIESHREEIKELLSCLPDSFKKSGGKGMSFLNACVDKDNIQWGEHRNMEQLFSLGIALGLAGYCMPKDMWRILPGGMPYLWVEA